MEVNRQGQKFAGAVGEGGLAHSDDTLRGAIEPKWRT